jgi:hypothetical protein
VFVIHKLINSIWNKEELPDQWKESIIVSIHKMGNKTDSTIYHGISLRATSDKILSNSLSRLSGDHQYGVHHSRSATDLIFYIRQILEKEVVVQ